MSNSLSRKRLVPKNYSLLDYFISLNKNNSLKNGCDFAYIDTIPLTVYKWCPNQQVNFNLTAEVGSQATVSICGFGDRNDFMQYALRLNGEWINFASIGQKFSFIVQQNSTSTIQYVAHIAIPIRTEEDYGSYFFEAIKEYKTILALNIYVGPPGNKLRTALHESIDMVHLLAGLIPSVLVVTVSVTVFLAVRYIRKVRQKKEFLCKKNPNTTNLEEEYEEEYHTIEDTLDDMNTRSESNQDNPKMVDEDFLRRQDKEDCTVPSPPLPPRPQDQLYTSPEFTPLRKNLTEEINNDDKASENAESEYRIPQLQKRKFDRCSDSLSHPDGLNHIKELDKSQTNSKGCKKTTTFQLVVKSEENDIDFSIYDTTVCEVQKDDHHYQAVTDHLNQKNKGDHDIDIQTESEDYLIPFQNYNYLINPLGLQNAEYFIFDGTENTKDLPLENEDFMSASCTSKVRLGEAGAQEDNIVISLSSSQFDKKIRHKDMRPEVEGVLNSHAPKHYQFNGSNGLKDTFIGEVCRLPTPATDYFKWDGSDSTKDTLIGDKVTTISPSSGYFEWDGSDAPRDTLIGDKVTTSSPSSDYFKWDGSNSTTDMTIGVKSALFSHSSDNIR